MWKDLTKKRYFWAAVQEDFDQFLKDLKAIEEEEETDLFRLNLHKRSAADLSVFKPEERDEIVRLLEKLIGDTRGHARYLKRIIGVMARFRRTFDDV